MNDYMFSKGAHFLFKRKHFDMILLWDTARLTFLEPESQYSLHHLNTDGN